MSRGCCASVPSRRSVPPCRGSRSRSTSPAVHSRSCRRPARRSAPARRRSGSGGATIRGRSRRSCASPRRRGWVSPVRRGIASWWSHPAPLPCRRDRPTAAREQDASFETQFLQDRGAVLIELWCGGTGLRILVRAELYWIALHADRAELRVERLDDHVAVKDLRVVHHLRFVVQRAAGHAGGIQRIEPVLRAMGRECHLHLLM